MNAKSTFYNKNLSKPVFSNNVFPSVHFVIKPMFFENAFRNIRPAPYWDPYLLIHSNMNMPAKP